MNGFGNIFRSTPRVVKNLVLINALILLATYSLNRMGIVDLYQYLSIYNFKSDLFEPYQLITHMFMHGSMLHLFFNMFALWMFGKVLEMAWGGKRFFIYFIVTGLGAALIHLSVQFFEISSMQQAIDAFNISPTPDNFKIFLREFTPFLKDFSYFEELIMPDQRLEYISEVNKEIYRFIGSWELNPDEKAYIASSLNHLKAIELSALNIPTVGASGAVFGVLLAFGMLFPNTQLMLIFPPIPIKAKYMVIIYGVAELFFGVANFSGDNLAHFAHLGGMIFGFIMIKMWGKDTKTFY